MQLPTPRSISVRGPEVYKNGNASNLARTRFETLKELRIASVIKKFKRSSAECTELLKQGGIRMGGAGPPFTHPFTARTNTTLLSEYFVSHEEYRCYSNEGYLTPILLTWSIE
jgi:hypothetical protein